MDWLWFDQSEEVKHVSGRRNWSLIYPSPRHDGNFTSSTKLVRERCTSFLKMPVFSKGPRRGGHEDMGMVKRSCRGKVQRKAQTLHERSRMVCVKQPHFWCLPRNTFPVVANRGVEDTRWCQSLCDWHWYFSRILACFSEVAMISDGICLWRNMPQTG